MLTFALGACSTSWSTDVRPVFGGITALAPGGIEPDRWSHLLDATSLCHSWAQAAERRFSKKTDRRATASTISTISGLLAIGAGAATGIVAGAQDDSDDAVDVSRVGGIASSVFGIGATVTGLIAGVQGAAASEAKEVSVRLERVAAGRSLEAIAAPQRVTHTAARMAFECAREARRLDAIAELPLSQEARPGAYKLAEILRRDPSENAEAEILNLLQSTP